MTAGAPSRDLARPWVSAAILTQVAAVFSAVVGFYSLNPGSFSSPIGLATVAASNGKVSVIACTALVGAASSFCILLLMLLGHEPEVHDWWMAMSWLLSAATFAAILRFRAFPMTVCIALAFAVVVGQAGASIGDILAEERHDSYGSMLIWFHIVALALSIAGYQIGFHAKMSRLHSTLAGVGFKVIYLEDITKGILRSIEREEQRKADLILSKVPRWLRNATVHFAGLGKGERSDQFVAGEKLYVAAVLQKQS